MNATTATHDAPRPAWYMAAAIAALSWNLLGVAMFAMQYTMSAETLAMLPVEQQSLYAALPGWAWVAYGLAVFAGALGSLMLVLRRRAASWLLLVSLIAVIVQFVHQAVLSQAVALLGPVEALGLPLLILVVAAVLYWFARRATGQGWLR